MPTEWESMSKRVAECAIPRKNVLFNVPGNAKRLPRSLITEFVFNQIHWVVSGDPPAVGSSASSIGESVGSVF